MYQIVKAPPIHGDYGEVIPIGDLHYGSPHQDRAKVKKLINYIIERNEWAIQHLGEPIVFAVTIGDVLDLSLVRSFGVIGEDRSIKQAIREFKEDFYPLIKLGYLLGGVPGNHDIRVTKHTGSSIDLVEEVFYDAEREYGIVCKYGSPHLIIVSRVGRSSFVGFLTHGSGGAGTVGGVANTMMKNVNELSDFDWSAQGHFHLGVEVPNLERTYFDRRSCTIQTQPQFFCTTGSFLKKHGYAAVGRMLNGGTNTPILELHASPQSNHTKPKEIQSRVFRG